MQELCGGERVFECCLMAVVAGADDDQLRLGGVTKLWRIGGRASVMGADEQAAGLEQWEELLLSVTFKIAGEANGVSGEVQECREAGFVVCGGGICVGVECSLEEANVECLQGDGIFVSGDCDGDFELLEAIEQAADFEGVGAGELAGCDDLSDGHAFDKTGGGVVVIGIGVRDDDGIDHAVSAVPEKT